MKRPQFISLLIETDNIPNAIAARDTSSTLLWKAFHAITDIDSNAETADMEDKEKIDLAIGRVAMSEIGKDDEIPAYVHFARDWSGGATDPFVLREFDDFVKASQEVRDVPRAVLERLTKIDLGTGAGAFVRVAVLKLASDPVERPVLTGDISNLSTTRTRPHTLQADRHMVESRQVIKQAKKHVGVDQERLQRAVDYFDKRLIKHVLNRSKDFKNMTEICTSFLHEVCVDAGASSVGCPSHWHPQASKAQESRKRSIAELSQSGFNLDLAKEALKQKNCVIGAHCVYADNHLPYKVMAIDSDGLVLQAVGLQRDAYKEHVSIKVPHESISSKFKSFFQPQDALS